jgi:hypothetical protein
MQVVNVVATCKKVAEVPADVPYEELKNGKKYYFLREDVIAVIFNTGKVKLFSPQYPPPNLPYFSDCRIENLVVVTEVPAIPLEELLEMLERRGFVIGDREKVNAVLAYRGKTTVRIFPKADSDVYKAVIFARSEKDAEETIRLLTTSP